MLKLEALIFNLKELTNILISDFWPYRSNGESIGLWSFGTTIYVTAVVIVNMQLATHVSSWTLIQILLLIATICSLFIFLLLLSIFFSAKDIIEDFDSIGYDLFYKPLFWLLLILSPVIACFPNIVCSTFHERSNPTDATILRELENGWRDGKFINNSLDQKEVTYAPSSIKSKEQVGCIVEENIEANETAEFPLVAGVIARRKTWREIVSNERFDATDHTNSATWDGKKRSSGFHMVTRLSAPHQKPRPLQAGPAPLHRKFFQIFNTHINFKSLLLI